MHEVHAEAQRLLEVRPAGMLDLADGTLATLRMGHALTPISTHERHGGEGGGVLHCPCCSERRQHLATATTCAVPAAFGGPRRH